MSKEEYLDQLLASITEGEPIIEDSVVQPFIETVEDIEQNSNQEQKILEPESKLLNDDWDALNKEIHMATEHEAKQMNDYEIPEQGVLDIEDDIDYDRIQQLMDEEEDLEELLKKDDFSLEAFVQDIIDSSEGNEFVDTMDVMSNGLDVSLSEETIPEPILQEAVLEEPAIEEVYNHIEKETQIDEPVIKDVVEKEVKEQTVSPSIVEDEVEEFNLTSMLEESSSINDTVKDVSDVIEQSLSAVTSMEDELLEKQVEQIQEALVEGKAAKGLKERILSFFKKKEKVVESATEELISEVEELVTEPTETEKTEEAKNVKKTKKAKKEKDPVKQAELDKKKQEKALKKAEKKKEKQAKKMEQQAIDAANYVPINKKAVAFCFTVVAMLGVVVYVSSTKFTYQLHVNNAKKYFEHTEYSKAYTTLLGMELKESDQILMDRVEVIMRVNKQIITHERNLALGRDIEALDALLKGLERYQSNYDKAATLSVSMNLDSLKQSILRTLNEVYHISEEEASQIILIESQQEYMDKLSQYITK